MTTIQLNDLTRTHTAFQSFVLLTDTIGSDYFPTLIGEEKGQLADAYDEEMERRGDQRRAWRGIQPAADGSSIQPAEVPLDVFSRAKADADGGLVLFRVGDYYLALNEDAEVVSRVLGVKIQTPAIGMLTRRAREGGACRKQILLTEAHLQRNLRLLRADGNEDIWIATQGGRAEPVDTLGEIDVEKRDHIEALSRN